MGPARLKFYERIGGSETADKLAEAEQLATVDRDRFLHQAGAREPHALNPDNWAIDAYAFSVTADRVFMARLLMNMEANIPHYARWNAYLKDRQPKTLIVWGRNDPFLRTAAAESVKRNVPSAELRYFDGATSCSTRTRTRSPRRSSRRSPDRDQRGTSKPH